MSTPPDQPPGPESPEPDSPGRGARRGAEFRRRFRGYDRDEVDHQLAHVAATLARTEAEQQRLREQVERLESVAAESEDLEEMLRDALVSAERSAKELEERTQRERDEILREADESAARTRRQTDAYRREAEEAVERIREIEAEARERCRATLLAALEHLEGAAASTQPPERDTAAYEEPAANTPTREESKPDGAAGPARASSAVTDGSQRPPARPEPAERSLIEILTGLRRHRRRSRR